MREWHIITCEYLPRVGGISDYTFSIASGLGAAGQRVHVWCPATNGPAPQRPGVTVHQELATFSPREWRRMGRALNELPGPRRLLVQWVPHGYGYRSVNLAFALWLGCRAWIRGDELQLMIHEPYLRLAWPPKYLAASIVHRLMLAIAGSGATRIWISIPRWAGMVRPYVSRRAPIAWLPVPAPTLRAASAEAIARVRAQTAPDRRIVGHFSSYSPVVTPLLEAALDVVMRQSDAHALLIGRDGNAFCKTFLASRPHVADRVHATGVLEPDALSSHIAACDLMIQPFPDGINARHSSALASLSLGQPVSTNSGPHTESFWSESDAVALVQARDGRPVGEAAVELLDDTSRRAHLARRGLELYSRLFDVRHAVSALQRVADSPLHPAPQTAAVPQ